MAKPGLKLYDVLPQYIRLKDENAHTREYLTAADSLLGKIHQTLRQYYADNFPDGSEEQESQPWLLPYFADLLNARLVSPLIEGKRDEVNHAVRWRQRKGTRTVVDEVAQAVGQWEVVVQEAWQRIAQTPRLDEPLLPESYYGLDETVEPTIFSDMAKHPGLPAVTPDFRLGSRAVADEDHHPNSQVSSVRGKTVRWRQQYPHGIPCNHQRIDLAGEFQASTFDDVSKRTPDLRSSDWRVGHYHPRKILLYVVQPEGFFSSQAPRVQWRQQWLDKEILPSDNFLNWVTLYTRLDRTLVFENRHLGGPRFFPVEIRGIFKLGQVPGSGVGSPDAGRYHFSGLVLENSVEVDSGTVSLDRCAVRHIEVHSRYAGDDPRHLVEPVIDAKDTLFHSIQAATSLARLEYCTVLRKCLVESLQASDTLFTCLIQKDHLTLVPPDKQCIRYSRIHSDQMPLNLDAKFHNTRAPLWFFSDTFGEPGCGVLHPATEPEIRYGAEDGTEVGCYHFLQLSLRFEAVTDKLKDFLPLGYEAIVVPDEHLAHLADEM